MNARLGAMRLLACCLFFCSLGAGAAPGFDRPIVLTQVPAEAAPAAPGHPHPCPPGSRIVRLSPGGRLDVLTPDFAAACDPDVSFDGLRILFAARKTASDPMRIYELDPEGGGAVRIADGPGDCREPLYLAPASVTPPSFEDPVGWIAFTASAQDLLDGEGREGPTSLYVRSLEAVRGRGRVLWRTTNNPGRDVSPTVLPDGRVLYASRQAGRTRLMTVTWAGDNPNLFYLPPPGAIPSMACPSLGGGDVLFVESTPEAPGGRLVSVSLSRPLHSRRLLGGGPGSFLTPHPLSNDTILVAHSDPEGGYGIYCFDVEAGRLGEAVLDDDAYHEFDAHVAAPRPKPPARIPMLEFASVLDIEGFQDAGQLHCMSVYDSDLPEVAGLERGTVRSVRFVRGVPCLAGEADRCCGEPAGRKDAWPPACVDTALLGEAPVEPDGSFFVNVPGNIPFYVELLDGKDKVLQTMTAWTWVRSRSQRGCIGCHEDREWAPQNRATDALLKMNPTSLSPGGGEASRGGGGPPEGKTLPCHEPVHREVNHDALP